MKSQRTKLCCCGRLVLRQLRKAEDCQVVLRGLMGMVTGKDVGAPSRDSVGLKEWKDSMESNEILKY